MRSALASLPPSVRRKVLFKVTPSNIPAGSTFTRATTATYKDIGGTRQTAGINVLRNAHYIGGVPTILLEGASTNHFLNSAAPATQTSPSLSTGTYTLWMEGTGSIAVAGTTATITGAGTASAGTNVTFTVTVAGTVTYTITGSPTLAQAENLPFASSYIPTVGASVTRSGDVDQSPFPSTPIPMTFYAKFIELGTAYAGGSARVMEISNAGANPRFLLYCPSNYTIFHNNNVVATQTSQAGAPPALGNTVELRGVLFPDGSVQIGQAINGGAEVLGALSSPAALAPSWNTSVVNMNANGSGGNQGYAAYMKFLFASGVRSLAEMQNL